MTFGCSTKARLSGLLWVTSCSLALGAGGKVDVIYTEIPGSPTASVPGAVDASGVPDPTAEFIALEDMNVEHNGNEWVVKARTGQGSTVDSILIRGSGLSGTAWAQDNQPFLGGVPGELYDFFDSLRPVAWDDFGNIAFSARAKGGSSAVFEKVVVFDGVNHTIVLQMGDPAMALVDIMSNPTGDETFGNSIGSVHLMNSGVVGFVNTPIQNCSSFRYPAFFHGNTSFRQSGVSLIGGSSETWDTFGLSDAGGTPDGLHWYAEGETENSNAAIDKVLVVDDAIVLQEGSTVGGSTMILTDIFDTRMLSNGDWFSRGDDPSDNDWAVRNGVLLVKTGDPISGSENWGNSFGTLTGNRVGDWLLAGNTSEADTTLDTVLTVNNEVILRESDPIDVDGNGTFDDDAFINSFAPNDAFLTDDCVIYTIATLKNGAGTSIGDVFMRIVLCGDVTSYGAGCPSGGGAVPVLASTGCARAGETFGLSISNAAASSTAIIFLGLGQASIPMDGSCFALLVPLPGLIALPTSPSGTAALAGPLPPISAGFTFTTQAFIVDGTVAHGYTNSNGLEVAVK